MDVRSPGRSPAPLRQDLRFQETSGDPRVPFRPTGKRGEVRTGSLCLEARARLPTAPPLPSTAEPPSTRLVTAKLCS